MTAEGDWDRTRMSSSPPAYEMLRKAREAEARRRARLDALGAASDAEIAGMVARERAREAGRPAWLRALLWGWRRLRAALRASSGPRR